MDTLLNVGRVGGRVKEMALVLSPGKQKATTMRVDRAFLLVNWNSRVK